MPSLGPITAFKAISFRGLQSDGTPTFAAATTGTFAFGIAQADAATNSPVDFWGPGSYVTNPDWNFNSTGHLAVIDAIGTLGQWDNTISNLNRVGIIMSPTTIWFWPEWPIKFASAGTALKVDTLGYLST